MTNPPNHDIFTAEQRKKWIKVHGKDGIQMNTAMIFGYLKNKRYDEALESKQGLVLAYTFLRERKHRRL